MAGNQKKLLSSPAGSSLSWRSKLPLTCSALTKKFFIVFPANTIGSLELNSYQRPVTNIFSNRIWMDAKFLSNLLNRQPFWFLGHNTIILMNSNRVRSYLSIRTSAITVNQSKGKLELTLTTAIIRVIPNDNELNASMTNQLG